MTDQTPVSPELPELPESAEQSEADAPLTPAVTAATDAPTEAPTGTAPAATPAETSAKLKELFPALFAGQGFRPLKLRIQADIQERAPGQFTKAQLSAFFRRYTGSTGYLIALSKAKQRFDLDGQPAGELAEEHLAAAREELVRRKGLQQERVAAEQAGQQLLQQQRYNRAGLLHDYERTTLTLKNFCTLKGVSEEELPGLLEIARTERAEMPPAPPRPQRPEAAAGRRDPREPRGNDRNERNDRRPPNDNAGDRRGPPRGGARPPAGKR